MKNFDLKKFKDFVNTYDSQRGHKEYEVSTIIDDFLYGIGLCLNEEEYEFADGYQKFKDVLREHLNGKMDMKMCRCGEVIIEQEKRTTCHCGNPIDTTNPDCMEFNLCKDHATDA